MSQAEVAGEGVVAVVSERSDTPTEVRGRGSNFVPSFHMKDGELAPEGAPATTPDAIVLRRPAPFMHRGATAWILTGISFYVYHFVIYTRSLKGIQLC